jgi:hypothetical protein
VPGGQVVEDSLQIAVGPGRIHRIQPLAVLVCAEAPLGQRVSQITGRLFAFRV